MISASQGRVKMEEFAVIPVEDTFAAARQVSLGATAIVNIIAIMYSCKKGFHTVVNMS